MTHGQRPPPPAQGGSVLRCKIPGIRWGGSRWHGLPTTGLALPIGCIPVPPGPGHSQQPQLDLSGQGGASDSRPVSGSGCCEVSVQLEAAFSETLSPSEVPAVGMLGYQPTGGGDNLGPRMSEDLPEVAPGRCPILPEGGHYTNQAPPFAAHAEGPPGPSWGPGCPFALRSKEFGWGISPDRYPGAPGVAHVRGGPTEGPAYWPGWGTVPRPNTNRGQRQIANLRPQPPPGLLSWVQGNTRRAKARQGPGQVPPRFS